MNTDVLDAHKYSNNHKAELERDSVCGCFNCLGIFHPREIEEWIINVINLRPRNLRRDACASMDALTQTCFSVLDSFCRGAQVPRA